MSEKTWLVNRRGITFVTTKRTRQVLHENLDSLHCVDFTGKTVLDVGGYAGETMVLFHHWGAEKVIVVEPVIENHGLIRQNAFLHQVNYDLIPCGVTIDGADATIAYSWLNAGFGYMGGPYRYKIRGIKLSDLLQREPIDFAKFDCERCETALLSTPEELIGCIPDYIIECHSRSIGNSLKDMFERYGYQANLIDDAGMFQTYHFHRDRAL